MASTGYVIRLCDSADFERYKCPLCKELLRKPIQTLRGEAACQDCYNKAKRDDGKCPLDGEPLEKEFRDRAKEKDIQRLLCFCVYGCSWKGRVGELEVHMEQCEFKKSASCELCHEKLNTSTLKMHLEECSTLVSEGKCMYEGCVYQAGNIEALKNHLKKEVLLHTYLHTSTILSLKEESKKQSTILENVLKDVEVMKTNDEGKKVTKQVSYLLQAVKELQNTNSRLEAGIVQLKNDISLIKKKKINEGALSRSMPSLNNAGFSLSLEKKNTLNIPQSHSCPTSPDIIKLSSEIESISKNVFELDLRQKLHENTSYDGKLVWKIDNIDTRCLQANRGDITALHSAPTFSRRNEYKFCSRLYLNGDGAGRGTHVSLFFVLMKSEYDNLLHWPFRKKVAFTLINQLDRKKDRMESFIPDPSSVSFMKPKKELNIASGCPLFLTKYDFLNGGFVKDNCIYIEVKVGEDY